MELWYTENHTDNVKFSIKVDKHLRSAESEYQRIDIFESKRDCRATGRPLVHKRLPADLWRRWPKRCCWPHYR